MIKLEMTDYEPGESVFPKEEKLQQGAVWNLTRSILSVLMVTVLGVVHEGMILFGDVLLRLPDIVLKVRTHKYSQSKAVQKTSNNCIY